ncbi:MAG TPA: cyclic nucleotide-binding domain-containing protein [Actinomycetota bacterium]|jgi:CRP-like cAMP-binding protein|nr:cyclic nucleotide-binding domain-containing protein [Actinomycetota bacterium]
MPTGTDATGTSATPAPSSRKPALTLLADVPLFSGLSRPQLERVADLAQEVGYGAGRMIVRAGTPGAAFYVIVSGRAKVVKGKIASARGEAELGPGDFFGELALLDGGPRSASVVAAAPLSTVRIERAPFRRMLREDPDIGLKLLEAMAVRMRGMVESL